jgi:hypothetical protein
MKFKLKLFLRDDLRERLKKDASISSKFDVDNAAFTWINYDSDVVLSIFKLSEGTQGVRVHVLVELTKKELSQVPLFEVDARRVVHQPDEVEEKNEEYIGTCTYINTSGRTKLRIRDKIYLKSLKLKEDVIASIEFGEGYFCSSSVSRLLKNYDFTGYCEYPVIDFKDNSPLENYNLIGSENILPPLSEDMTIVTLKESPSDNVTFRRFGLASYNDDDLINAKDFNLSGESYGEDGCGLLIVSSRVRDVIKQNKIKGVAFTPILSRSTKLYSEYIKQFETLFRMLSVNPANVVS